MHIFLQLGPSPYLCRDKEIVLGGKIPDPNEKFPTKIPLTQNIVVRYKLTVGKR